MRMGSFPACRLAGVIVALLFCTLAFAQERPVSIDVADVPAKTVLQEIERQSGYRFFYNSGVTDMDFAFSLTISDAAVESVLQKLFAGTDITWRIEGREIVLAGKIQKKSTIRGRVTDTASEPLIGVSVYPKDNIQGGGYN